MTSTPDLNPGDKVKITSAFPNPKHHGKTGTVKRIQGGGAPYPVHLAEQPLDPIPTILKAEEVEPIQADAKFSVGDRVRVVGDESKDPMHFASPGDVGTVQSVRAGTTSVKYHVVALPHDTGGTFGQTINERDLEAAPEPEPRFQEGDRVILPDDSFGHGGGATVLEDDPRSPNTVVNPDNCQQVSECARWYMRTDAIEPEPEPEVSAGDVVRVTNPTSTRDGMLALVAGPVEGDGSIYDLELRFADLNVTVPYGLREVELVAEGESF